MAYLFLTVLGVVAVLLVGSQWPGRKALTFILFILIAGGIGFSLIDLFFLSDGDTIAKGPEAFKGISWFDMALYFVMIAGMMAKYLFDAIGDTDDINFQKWQFLKPILISPIVFGVIYSAIDQATSGLLLFIFSFQNGFFWQTVLKKV